MPWRWRSTTFVLVVLLACSSGGDGSGSGACGEVETLVEPGGDTHVIDPEAARFAHHPPSSGPHFAGNPPDAGVHDDPVPEALQVTALEFGAVVINYDPAIADDDRRALEALAEGRDDVVVTPAPVPIDEAAAMALTAWERRRLCDHVSVDAARAFIDEFAGEGPGEVVDGSSTSESGAP